MLKSEIFKYGLMINWLCGAGKQTVDLHENIVYTSLIDIPPIKKLNNGEIEPRYLLGICQGIRRILGKPHDTVSYTILQQ